MKLTESIEGRQYLLTIFTDYLSDKHMDEIKDMCLRSSNVEDDNVERCCVVKVDAMLLVQEHAWSSWYLLNDALRLLDIFNGALTRIVCCILGKSDSSRSAIVSQITSAKNTKDIIIPKCIVRLSSVPICEETTRTRMPRCSDVGHLLSISATVLHTSPLQVLQYQKQYQCNKCAHMFLTAIKESDATYTITPPKECPSCGKSSSITVSSNDTMFCRNRQQLRIQEQTRYLAVGMMPRSIIVIVDDDLVDCAQPGDDVIVIGTVIRRWKKHRPGDQCDAELVVLANNIQVMNHSLMDSESLNFEAKNEFQCFWKSFGSKRFSARNAIISQMCPLIYGMYYLKLALALVLSGSSTSNFNGLKVRGESHLLLVGDPGTAKSQFLKFASKVVPRSVITTGIGSTTAGLTVAAVKESNEWGLEAGALVLADGGVCCIDEFGGIREHDKTAIHEAMEQQTISVAKAGIVCKLRTRCSIIAATNPKGSYDIDRSISCNTAIASPLLSRFDLIFLLLDNCNETWDRQVSDFILNHQTINSTEDVFNIDKLKSYFLFIKSNFHPKMTSEASFVLEKYYSWMRKSESTKSLGQITMRFLESLIRLSQSHARFMMKDEVILEDAVMAIVIMESTVYGSTVLDPDQQLPSEFPLDPEKEYKLLEENVLNKLQISSVIKSDQNVSGKVTSKPIVKRSHYFTQPINNKSVSTNEKKLLNRSVLDNFHVVTQMRNQENIFQSEIELEDDLFNDLESKGTKRIRNMFQDSILDQAALNDADFDL